jgi:hypothetical protein
MERPEVSGKYALFLMGGVPIDPVETMSKGVVVRATKLFSLPGFPLGEVK